MVRILHVGNSEGKTGLLEQIRTLPETIHRLLDQRAGDRGQKTPLDRESESERRFRMIFEKAKEGIVIFDARGRVVEANPYTSVITGYDLQEVVGKDFMELLSAEERTGAERLMVQLRERGWSRGEFEMHTKDGRPICVEYSTTEVDQGVYQCVFRDVTERRRKEAEIFEQNKVLLAISDVSFSLMESMKLDDVLQSAVRKIKEITQGQFVGIYLLDDEETSLELVAHSDVSGSAPSAISHFDVNRSLTGEAVRSGRAMYVPSQLHTDNRITPQGRRMAEQEGWEAIAVIPLKAQDEVLGAIDVLFSMPREISTSERQMFTIIGSLVGAALESARLYEQTVEKSKEIERQNRELSDFTYVVSHDLKEPLVGLEGFSVMLLNQYGAQLDEEAKDYLQTLAKLSALMKTLINDLLNYASVGEESLAKEVVDVNDVIHHLQQELDLYVRQKKARIKVISPLPKVIYPNVALTEVFRNLISNAIKFCDKSQPTVEIGCGSNQTEHRFFVRDNGIGIHKEYFEKIFQIFQRLNYNERYEGTGIGLTITKKIVESYGGAIWVESAEGKGSTFFFTVLRKTTPSP